MKPMVFVGNTSFVKGVKSPIITKEFKEEFIENDILKRYTND